MTVKELLKKIEQRLFNDKELSEGRYCTYMKLVTKALIALQETCVWTKARNSGYWHTGCGKVVHKNTKEKGWGFCPFNSCGKPIQEAK